eukprot:6767779-Lingulodinium_polyedra.AAC.1
MECARRVMREPSRLRSVDLIASLCSVCKTLRNDASAIAVCRSSGSLIARSHTPCARQFSGAR